MPIATAHDGAPLHYEVHDFTDPWKNAPTIFLLHGFGRSSRFWYSLVPYLSRFFRVVCPDLRGLGESLPLPDALQTLTAANLLRDVSTVADHAGADRFHLVGESLTGTTNIIYAAENPHRVKSLTLLAPGVWVGPGTWTSRAYALDYPSWEDALRAIGVEEWVRRSNTLARFPADSDPAFLEWYTKEVGRTQLDSAIAVVGSRPLLTRALTSSPGSVFLCWRCIQAPAASHLQSSVRCCAPVSRKCESRRSIPRTRCWQCYDPQKSDTRSCSFRPCTRGWWPASSTMRSTMRFRDPQWAEQAVECIRVLGAEFHDEIEACERDARFPASAFEAMAKAGLLGVMTSPEYGGRGASAPEYCVLAQAMARHHLVSFQIMVQGQRWLSDWGTPAQKKRYLKGMARGEVLFSASISEPSAGSSLKKLDTKAKRHGSEWTITGQKTHVNLGCESQVTLVYADTDDGLTAFLVDTDLPGVSAQHTNSLGCRLIPTADMRFEDVRVAADAVLGEPGKGMATFLSTFNISRLGNASELIGQAKRALAEAIEYAHQREVGGSVVTGFQGIQWVVADCYAALHAASLARDHAANLVEAGQEHSFETSLAKKLAIDAAEQTINEVFALVGAHGLYHGQPFGQIMNEIKTLRVAGGSLEILRNYVAQQVLRDPAGRGLA